MCKVLGISRSSYYAYKEPVEQKDDVENLVTEIFYQNQSVYGTRKIKVELMKQAYQVSRRRIGRLMKKNELISVYTRPKYRVKSQCVNEEANSNLVHRQFHGRQRNEVIVSDLTYVRVAGQWNYICILLDLYNREIIGYSCGKHKDADLVYRAFASVKQNLASFQIFHTDRGSEFQNSKIDDLLSVFDIQRSLSAKGCPYDNAVAEAQFKIIKTEFIRSRCFQDLAQLQDELEVYVHWFHHHRIHSALDYQSPIQVKNFLR